MKDNLKIGDTVRIIKDSVVGGNRTQFRNEWSDTKEIYGKIYRIDKQQSPNLYILSINNAITVRLYEKRFEKINESAEIKSHNHPLTSMFSLTNKSKI